MAPIRRAAVLFKSRGGRGIFTIEKGLRNVPGGKHVSPEPLEETAMREVREELGCWPRFLDDISESSMFVDCGITRYFIVELAEEMFDSTFRRFRRAFPSRATRDAQKITKIEIKEINTICDAARTVLRKEVKELIHLLPKQNWHLQSGSARAVVDMDLAKTSESEPLLHGTDVSNVTWNQVTSSALLASASADLCALCDVAGKRLTACWECEAWTCKVCTSGARHVREVLGSTRYAVYAIAVDFFCDGLGMSGSVAGARHGTNDGRHPLFAHGATPRLCE